jgi:ribonuclease P protein component
MEVSSLKFTVSIKKNHEFRRLYAKGKSAVSPSLAIYCKKRTQRENRLGLTVGLKVGNAVIRNRVRRRLREIYRTNEHRMIPGYDVVIVARVKAAHASYRELEREFISKAKKLGLLMGEET